MAVGGAVWQGSRGRFLASEVKFDFFFMFLFLLVSWLVFALLCFCFLFFDFLRFSFLLMQRISIFSSFHICIFSKYIALP
jgi:hypothetical protein